jgi:ABC-2 type transport system ATP-binding protein
MSQRLGIAAALLGDPPVLMFDEPVNGLDPEGIRWIRTLMRSLAAQGRTILVSSHLMSEMALTADHLIVIGKGRLIADSSVDDVIKSSSGRAVLVRTPDAAALQDRLQNSGATVETRPDGAMMVQGLEAPSIGKLAAEGGLVLYELTPQEVSLEEAFMELTHDSVEFHAGDSAATPVPLGVGGK